MSHYDFRITFKSKVQITKLIKLQSCQIVFDEFLINDQNFQLQVKLANQQNFSTVSLTRNQNYDENSLALELQLRLRQINNSFAVTYNSDTYRYNITCNTDFTFNFGTNDDLAEILGFENTNGQNINSTGLTLKSTQSIQLSNPQEIVLFIPEINKTVQYTYSDQVSSQMSFLITNNQSRGGIIQFDSQTTYDDLIYLTQDISYLSVQIKKPNGKFFITNSPVSICFAYV